MANEINLYIPTGVKTDNELWGGFGKRELLQSKPPIGNPPESSKRLPRVKSGIVGHLTVFHFPAATQ